jgi:hypothetical protein
MPTPPKAASAPSILGYTLVTTKDFGLEVV